MKNRNKHNHKVQYHKHRHAHDMTNHKEGMMENEKFHPLYSQKDNIRDWEDQA